MIRKCLIIGIILLFVGVTIAPAIGQDTGKSQSSRGNWLYVGGSGPGNYTRIQDAIDNASDGYTVFVYSDSSPYYEYVKVNKSISLIGENRDTTVIDGNWGSNVINGTVDRITISGFTIRYSSMHGIFFHYSNNNSVSGNNIFSNGMYGIFLDHSNDNSIIDNIISNNHNGIDIWFSGNNNIESNAITSNSDGISLNGFDVEQNIIIQNTISNNYYNGIRFVSGKNNTIIGNNISSNHHDGIEFYGSSKNNTIYHNNLIKNTLNAEDFLNNTWDNGYPSGGNYWDDYNGTDDDGDGIGDTPYNIPGGDNQDLYPFMEPNGWVNSPPVANFTYNINELTVNFDASSSYDPDGNITLWLWDFGDQSGNHGEIITHNYTTSGTYKVKLYVIDDDNYQDSYSQEITVESYKKAIIFGRIDNLTTVDDKISFEMENTRVIIFSPFSWIPYTSGEKLIISNSYSGFVGSRYIFALCRMLI